MERLIMNKPKLEDVQWDNPSKPNTNDIQWDNQQTKSATITPQQPMSVVTMAKQALTNIPQSLEQFGSNIVQPFIHPVETVKNLYGIASGGVQKLTPGVQEDEAKFDAMTNYFKQRYGGLENIKQTIAKDPIGFSADLSTVLTGAGGIAKIGGLTKTGNILSSAGNITNPMIGISQIAKPLVNMGKGVASGIIGMTTGAGGQAVKTGAQGGKSFTKAMRGTTTGEDILNNTKSAIGTITDDMRQEYVTKLNNIRLDNTKMNNISNAVSTKLHRLLDKNEFDIGLTYMPTGEAILDFSRSPIVENVPTVQKAIQDVISWADNTPSGLDILKKRLTDYSYQVGEKTPAKKLITNLRNEIDFGLKNNVPEYNSMTSAYRKTSELLDDINKSLSTGGKASTETAIKKITSAMKDNNEFRLNLIKKIEDSTGTNIQSQIAGHSLSTAMPTGLVGKGIAIGETWRILSAFEPTLALGLLASSPRVVGEFLNVFSKGLKAYRIAQQKVPKGSTLGIYQLGRGANIEQPSP